MHFAHTRTGQPISEWEPLEEHLQSVADGGRGFQGAAAFATEFGAPDWARLAGLWHDLGKYSADYQAYLQAANDAGAHPTPRRAKVDHSTAGAQHALATFGGVTGRLLAYCIAGHHAGLPDNEDPQGGLSGLAARLRKTIPNYTEAPPRILNQKASLESSLVWDADPRVRAFQLSVFCRLLFSCLVDADYLATESFLRRERSEARHPVLLPPAELLQRLDAYLDGITRTASNGSVNRARADILAQCRAKAEMQRGLYSLTVPTGGGKTLSSLAFALTHAAYHGLRRVISAIPFTSIIEQNAQIFRRALADDTFKVVLEHHSNFDAPESADDLEPQTPWHRLAAENWDAPLIVTTNVQLFESLFANKPSRCRKLHRIVRSVIVLDECQTLPVTMLEPTLRMLAELCRNYGCTVVLCSATQPAVRHRNDFPIGLAGVREIIDMPIQLYQSMRRVAVTRLGKVEDDAVVARLREHDQVLCIVNTRAHAARLFTALRALDSDAGGVFHLSAQMCAAHRTRVLRAIRARLARGGPRPCRVISTQLVEAGVDVDFPVVYRALAGLDSVAQAAGRCNREGRLERGKVFVFETDVRPTHDVRRAAELAAEVANQHEDLLSLDAIDHYFRLMYWSRSADWDQEEIMKCFTISGDGPHFQFREAAERYRLIRDLQQPVIVPYGRRGRELVEHLRRSTRPPTRDFDRRAQRYVVGVYERQFNHLRDNLAVAQYHERFWVLADEAAYDDALGLRTNVAGFDPAQLCI